MSNINFIAVENSYKNSGKLLLLADKIDEGGAFATTSSIDKIYYNLSFLGSNFRKDLADSLSATDEAVTFVLRLGHYLIVICLHNQQHSGIMLFFKLNRDDTNLLLQTCQFLTETFSAELAQHFRQQFLLIDCSTEDNLVQLTIEAPELN